MTAINVNTVGPGKTYANLAAWETARQGNLVSEDRIEVAACFGGADLGPVSFTGWTTDATHYVLIRAASTNSGQVGGADASDEKFTKDGIILSTSTSALNAAGFAYVHLVGGESISFNPGCDHVYIEGLYVSMAPGLATLCEILFNNSQYGHVKNCFIYYSPSASGSGASYIFNGGYVHIQYINTMVVVDGRTYAPSASMVLWGTTCTSGSPDPYCVNCTAVYLGNDTGGIIRFYFNGNTLIRMRNCLSICTGNEKSETAFYGFVSTGIGNHIAENCASTDRSLLTAPLDTIIDCLSELDPADILRTDEIFLVHHRSPTRKKGRYDSNSIKGLFDTERLRPDIGAEQLALIVPNEIIEFFSDAGTLVKQRNEYIKEHVNMIIENDEAKTAQLDAGSSRLSILASSLDTSARNRSQLISWANQETMAVQSLVLGNLKSILESVVNDVAGILNDLDFWMGKHSETIEGIISSYQIIYDATGDGSLGSITIPQLVPQQNIVIECTSADTVGSEQWTVTGSILGTINGPATTNVQWTDTTTGLSFKISLKVGTDWAVGDRILLYIAEDPGAIFQKFFRDEFGYAFAQNEIDGSETIADSLAE